MSYGYELIIDLCGCDITTFNRKSLREYFKKLCKTIDMKRCELVFWDDKWTWLWKLIFFWDKTIQCAEEPHTNGITAVQFILTSNVTIHTLTKLKTAYINIFSCKVFDGKIAEKITREWFNAEECISHFIERI
jgi:S-adenosylmethionine/arginine decarboxylase-like enzyme